MKFGIDESRRYKEYDDGERFTIEAWPFLRWRYLPHDIFFHLYARVGIIIWHIGMIYQHGIREWWKLRKY